ncbi:2'-5' RNA ligase family protein [Legionella fallonii]|uniref:Uncharacterized protein n=1 Tax=Legionella fallonii LLAP-10 TaxID=1212491 RepID=A0A098G606_9GAMM|nr:2'-5' RNA ligase family protein [Legionella fallonii]CEG57404.1 protein of unknown function [Legionella fallonii LLAP-10]
MVQGYNIAYIPSRNQEHFIQVAQELAATAHPETYCLGPSSFPHISLCHFVMDSESIEGIWRQISNLSLPPLTLSFATRRSKSYANHPRWGGVCWISLMPDHLDELTRIHLEIAAIIKKPLNAAFKDYDPHLTLFNSCNEKACELFNKSPQVLPPLNEQFVVALGLLDEVGQITKILTSTNKLSL